MEIPDNRMTDALASYIDVLARGTRYANDRPQFSGHLARAAEMFSAIHAGDFPRLQNLIDAEIHTYGWSYLQSPEGDDVAAAWQRFLAVATPHNETAV
jgi:hypothetical protein